jgi:hypothetical protein
MTKKLFALLIASSIIALPIAAQDFAKKIEKRRQKEVAAAAHTEGFVQGFATAIIASSLTMCAYLSSIKDNLYIPADINPKMVPTGEHRWVETIEKISDTKTVKVGHLEPVFKRVWETNPLHTALKNASDTPLSINGTVHTKENMVETIGSYMPEVLTIACISTLCGIFVYYVMQLNEDPQHETVTPS